MLHSFKFELLKDKTESQPQKQLSGGILINHCSKKFLPGKQSRPLLGLEFADLLEKNSVMGFTGNLLELSRAAFQ